MKKLISIFLLVAMLISVIPCVALSAAAEGETQNTSTTDIPSVTTWDSTKNNDAVAEEYSISTAEELKFYADTISTNDRAFKLDTVYLMNDITFNEIVNASPTAGAPAEGYTWPEITTNTAGNFDGQGHTIRGIYQKTTGESSQCSGLFGKAYYNGTITIKNVRFENCYSESVSSEGHGFLFGYITTHGYVTVENVTFSNCYMNSSASKCNGFICGRITCGGSSANASSLTVKNVYVDARSRIVNSSTTGNADGIGGLIGGMPWGGKTIKEVLIQDTVFAGSIEVATATDYRVIGGLIGTGNCNSVTIENSASYATFKGEKGNALVLVGGIIGYQAAADATVTVNNCISACTNEITGATYGSVLGAGRINNGKYAYVAGTGNVTTSTVAAIGCAWTHSTPGTAYTSGDEYEAVCSKGITVTQDDNIRDNFATVLRGYQAKDAAGDTFDFRLVATVDIPENVTVDKVGFVITATYGDTRLTKNYSTNTVYTAVTGNTDTGLEEYTAEELGGDYIFALAITGAPVLTEDVITLKVTTYYVSGANTVYGATEVFTVTAPQDALN